MIDKFVFITDTHFKSRGPSSRNDDYFPALLKKLNYVIAYCKKKKVKVLLHGGDFWDNPFVSEYVAGIVAKVLRKSKLKVYAIMGQHDVTGKNRDSYKNGKMHTFESYPWFHLLGGRYIEFNNCFVTGHDFDIEMDCPDSIMIEPQHKPVICLAHAMISEDKSIEIDGHYQIREWGSVTTNAALMLTGDYHLGIKPNSHALCGQWCNPGSFARTSITDTKGIGPGLAYVRVLRGGEIKVQHHVIPHKDVFVNTDVITDVDKQLKFERAFAELQDKDIIEGDVFKIIDSIRKNVPKNMKHIINKRLINLCKERLKKVRDEKSSGINN